MKVIGIFIVVWGHCFPEGLTPFVYAFNVPVFFVLSGYLTRDTHAPNYYGKLATTLIVPYGLLALIKAAGFMLKHLADGKALVSLLLLVTGFHSYEDVSGCSNLWFVYSLIIIKAVFPRISHRVSRLFVLSMVSFALALAWQQLGTGLCWAVPNVLLAFPFYALGFCLRKLWSSKVEQVVGLVAGTLPRWQTALALLVLAVSTYSVAGFNGEAYMFKTSYGNSMVLFVVGAMCGSLIVFLLSALLDRVANRGMRYISIGTIVILVFHREFLHPMLKAIGKLDTGIWVDNLLVLASAFLATVAFIPIIYLLKKYAPIFIGRRHF